MSDQGEMTPDLKVERDGERLRTMLSRVQALQERPDAVKREYTEPADGTARAVESTEYTIQLSPVSKFHHIGEYLHLEVERPKKTKRLERPATTYSVRKYKDHDKTHFAGNAGYEMYVSSRLVMVEQPQFLRPSKITVTEATQRQERPNVPFREIASYKTLDEQEAFVGSLLTT
ncbi:hypothetical protein A3D80_03785 [Candidatus Roizmanbacteria bacterium RIFCSPHIGHO2_02_FULL_40_13b]|uniref:Uncharacterized protein n=1 Tax=Candidatus Roizmanbacteria bacterium RIFCSPHIGHO2_01_FULL_39_24 TaxID=1802032 RepID=A0A1F7GEZ9_9BACT|nr:MAG: hypothetical protein A2799_03150 [Candidatus Roizmanbacteria bacterium RIFCSPHIGHO2_01_FULL_39_24]OGK27916.1 MAG: hypothetical protein A3D80_03785 [Candidatus Roizmanbacteria bacterium RIFCSPHIGHO2_02_FULL_40_13b]